MSAVSYSYQAPMPQQYYQPQAMPMMQQPMYVTEPSRNGAQPMNMQPMVMAPAPCHPQFAPSMPRAMAPQPSPVYFYPPQIMMSPAPQPQMMVMNPAPQPRAMQCSQPEMEFTVEETTEWFTELCMMRGWNADAEAYKAIFVRHQLCGSKMKTLNYEDLTVLGFKKEHRLDILEAIEQALEEQSSFYSQNTPIDVRSSVTDQENAGLSDSASGETDSEMQMSDQEMRNTCDWSQRSAYMQQPEPVRMHSSCPPSPSGFGRTRVQPSFARSMDMDMCPSENSATETVQAPKKKIMPRPKNPMQYRVLMTLKMKTGRSLQSTYVGTVNQHAVVWVNTVRGRRARIIEKTADGTKNRGWVSLRTEDGKPLLVQEQEYRSNPSLYPMRESDSGCPIDGA